jgi:hypothetical protein
MREHEAYMGDGLYASIDPATDTLWLRAPRGTLNHVVALEPPVLQRVVAYMLERGFIAEVERALNAHRERAG